MSRLKNQLKTGLKLLLTGLALYLVFRKIDTDQLFQLAKTIHWIWLLPAIILFILSKVATAIRLNRYFENIGIKLSESQNWKLYLIGMFYNLFLPGGIGGDGYKVYLLNKEFKTPVKKLVQAALLDRLGGLVAIVFLLFGWPLICYLLSKYFSLNFIARLISFAGTLSSFLIKPCAAITSESLLSVLSQKTSILICFPP